MAVAVCLCVAVCMCVSVCACARVETGRDSDRDYGREREAGTENNF